MKSYKQPPAGHEFRIMDLQSKLRFDSYWFDGRTYTRVYDDEVGKTARSALAKYAVPLLPYRLQKQETLINVLNQTIGGVRSHTQRKICQTCGKEQPHKNLNWHSFIYAEAPRLECLDRKACYQRAKRKGRR